MTPPASIIRLRGLRVTGIVAGECSSAAILPFAACERRFVTPHSTLLFHPVRWASEEDFQAWMASAAFGEGHKQHAGDGPVSTGAELWQFDVVQHEEAPEA